MRPMLATSGTAAGRDATVPEGPGWVHEVKWDGIRLLAEVRTGTLTLRTRSERDVTAAFPELGPLAGVADDLLLDGEVVAMVDGTPSFSRLVERVHVVSPRTARTLAAARPTTYLVFDLLRLDGHDLTGLPWRRRREALEEVLPPGATWQVPPVFPDGRQLLAATAQQGLEGIVSKRVDAPYRAGERSPDWLKFPHRATASVVVGGWRPQTGSSRLGSLLVGVPASGGGLRFRGRVGSGLAGRAGQALAQRIAEVAPGPCPFVDEVPRADAAGAHWLTPELVVDVASLGLTGGERLRQPSYKGWRPDLAAEDV